MTRSCLRTIFASITIYVAAVVLFFLYLRPVAEHHDAIGPVIMVAAACVWLSAIYFNGIFGKRREQELVRAAMRGDHLKPGERAAFVGKLDSPERFRAPLSGREAIIYKYSISRGTVRQGSSGTTILVSGEAFPPLSLLTSSGTLRVFCRPFLRVPTPPIEDRAAAQRHFETYRAATTFTQMRRIFDPVPRFAGADSGLLHRRDEYNDEETVSWSTDSLSEEVVAPREQVTLFGVYSSERGGIIADPLLVELIPGSPDQVIANLSRKAKWFGFAAIVFLIAALAIPWGYKQWMENERSQERVTLHSQKVAD